MKRNIESESLDPRWRGLRKLGGVSALVIAPLLLGEVAVYALQLRAATALDAIRLFNESWIAGLLTFDLLGMFSYLLFVPVILALYLILRRTAEGITLVAAVLFFVGIASFFATNTAFPMLTLAQHYEAAATEAERAMNLAAGESMLTLFNENAFLVTYVIVSGSWAMISAVMLKGGPFGRPTAWAGILAGGTGIVAVVCEHALPAGVIGIAIAFYFAAIVFLLAWVVLVGRRLLMMGASGAERRKK